MGRRASAGFTLIELLMVVAIVTVATVVAWPTLSTFMGRSGEAGTATAAARLFNRVRDQARRRNRAYLVRFDDFSQVEPTGTMRLIEGSTGSCRALHAAPGGGQELQIVPYGQTPQGNYDGHVEKKVGLRGWVAPGEEALRAATLDVCVQPDGSATWQQSGGTPVPIAGALRVLVQRFNFEGGGWRIEGPPRGVEMTFAGGARMGVN